jgi:hypothetical protein
VVVARAERALSKARLFRVLGYEPHAIQRQVHTSDAQDRTLACGTRWGKTTCAAMEAIAAALEPSEARYVRRGWIVAPSYELADKVFRELVLIVRTKLPFLIVEAGELTEAHRSPMRLLLRNMGGGITEIRGKTADNPDSLLGEGLDFCIVDEAARLKPAIWDSYLSARLMDRRGWSLLISTPKGKGWFYSKFRECQRNGAAWNAPTWTNPHISREELSKRRAMTPDLVWQQEYGAAFIEGAGAVFRNVRELATGEWSEPKKGESYYGGLDLAKVQDWTVDLIMDGQRRVVAMDRFQRIDWSSQRLRIGVLTKHYNNAWTTVDSTGAGEPIFESLAEAGLRVEGYPFTNASKSALVNNLALQLEQRSVTLPRPELAPELIDELEAFEYTVTDAGNVKTGAPPGYHDDCAVACMLAAWSARDTGEFEVAFV